VSDFEERAVRYANQVRPPRALAALIALRAAAGGQGETLDYELDNALITTSEAADLVHVSPATIRSWKHRGSLKPDSTDQSGRPLYRPLDVLDAEAANRSADPAKKRQTARRVDDDQNRVQR
jgi:hypothetical protein